MKDHTSPDGFMYFFLPKCDLLIQIFDVMLKKKILCNKNVLCVSLSVSVTGV